MHNNGQTMTIRCPYCVEGNSFKAMIVQGSGEDWYMCVRCGHLIMPTNPSFECTCAGCVRLTSLLLIRRRPAGSGAIRTRLFLVADFLLTPIELLYQSLLDLG